MHMCCHGLRRWCGWKVGVWGGGLGCSPRSIIFQVCFRQPWQTWLAAAAVGTPFISTRTHAHSNTLTHTTKYTHTHTHIQTHLHKRTPKLTYTHAPPPPLLGAQLDVAAGRHGRGHALLPQPRDLPEQAVQPEERHLVAGLCAVRDDRGTARV